MVTKTVAPAEGRTVPASNRYGPDNPHPLSQLKTQLVWDGKYDEYGGRREVDIAGAALPLQKIETIDEPRSRAEAVGDQKTLFALNEQAQKLGDFRNQLIWGDNKLVMASLLKDFAGGINLIYIDPPFDVGADFTMDVPVGDKGESVGKDQSTLELVAYRDMWGRGTDSYLHMMYERLVLMRELLNEKGSIYVHVGPGVSHLVRAVCDDVFGKNAINEVIWKRADAHNDPVKYGVIHDSLLYYSKGETRTWNAPKVSLVDAKLETDSHYVWDSSRNKYFRLVDLKAPGGRGPRYSYKGVERNWKWVEQQLRAADHAGELYFTKNGIPFYKLWIENPEMGVQDIWADIAQLKSGDEKVDYTTQKPEVLLERVISASSREGDLVADFFCGSGTTGVVAERLGRRWIMADLGRFAIHTSRKRLIELQRELHTAGQTYRAFDIYNLGRYERQWWQKEHLKGANREHRSIVLEFYKAEPIQELYVTPDPRSQGTCFSPCGQHRQYIHSTRTQDRSRGSEGSGC